MSAPARVFTQQELLKEVSTGRQAKPMKLQPGDVIGDLRILREVEPPGGPIKAGKWFAVQCDCGEVFSRRASKILWAARRTASPCCSECRKRLRKLHHETTSEEVRFRVRSMFYDTGSLYSRRAVSEMEDDIMDELEREIAPRREMDVERELRWGFWVDPTRNESCPDATREREIEERHFGLRVKEAARAKHHEIHETLGQYATKPEPDVTHVSHVPVRPTKAPLPTGSTEVDDTFFAEVRAAGTFWSEPCSCGSGKLYARCHGRQQPCPCFSGIRFALCHGATLPSSKAGSK